MANLSNAIIEARKRHEAEIAERLKRRQERQRAEVDRLNQSATGTADAPASREPSSVTQAAERIETIARPVEPPAPVADATQSATATAVDHRPEAEMSARVEPPPTASPRVLSHVHAPLIEPPQPSQPVAPETAPVVYAPPPAPEPTVYAPVPRPETAPIVDELETPPDGRFLKLRNDIIDRVKPYLTGNQFAVYLEIYRQTIGRGRTSAWFRTREIQAACNLGSDNTVRDAYPALEAKRLIKLDPNRRVGSPKGLLITVLSVERALERLERGQPATATVFAPEPAAPMASATQPAAPQYYVNPTSLPAAPPPVSPADEADLNASLLDALKRKYGVSPTVAPAMLDLVAPGDRGLIPYLLRHLDRGVAAGKVHNPAGLLRVWLESFDAWRPELDAEKQADEQARRAAAEALSKDELMLEWFREIDELVQQRYAALDEDSRETMRLRGRRQMLAKSPSVRSWNEQQWESQLEIYVKAEIRRELGTFEEWLARRESR